MKLGSMIIDTIELSSCEDDVVMAKLLLPVISTLAKNKQRRGRIEIHSLEDDPWPTERPDEWGAGHYVEVRWKDEIQKGIVICLLHMQRSVGVFLMPLNSYVFIHQDDITAYGPRAAEV